MNFSQISTKFTGNLHFFVNFLDFLNKIHDFCQKTVNKAVFFNKIHGFVDKIVNRMYNKNSKLNRCKKYQKYGKYKSYPIHGDDDKWVHR